MQYIVNIPPDIVDVINTQISKGDYRTVQDFIITAVQNQVYLINQTEITPQITSVEPKIESKSELTRGNYKIELHEFDYTKGYSTLSGFWNKFLPVKITVRMLSDYLSSYEGPMVLETLQEVASTKARKIGLLLTRTEKKSGRKRGDRLFTGLPVGSNSEKSKTRFKSHFVGNLTRNYIDGMPGTLRLLTMKKDQDGKVIVGLTKKGKKFADMINPIIDQKDYSRTLSEEEQSYLSILIENELPEEFKRIQSIIGQIREGDYGTKEILRKMTIYKDLSDQKKATELSGLLNRITDLGLVIRRYDGLSYIYMKPTKINIMRG